MNPKRQMLKSSAVVAFFSLLGALTGILVETCIAAKLGLSLRSDSFYVAYTIPYIITNLLGATGQFSLVPFFASLESSQDEQEIWRGLSYVGNMLFLGLGAIAAAGAAAAPWIVHGIAPGFTPGQFAEATHLARWLFIIIVPAGIGEVMRSFLLSRHYFALSTATGLMRNASCIVVILAGFHRFGAQSIFLGYLAGYLLQVAALGLQMLKSFRPRYSLTLRASGKSFRNLRGSGSAQLGGALGWQGVVIVERIIASFLPAGTLTALNYGFRIIGTLSELLGGSVGTASLPSLSRAVARQERQEERQILRDTLGISLALLAPMMVFCVLLSHDIIRLVFQRGNFTPQATLTMAMVLYYYSWSLVPFAFIRILNFYLFARHESGLFLRLSIFEYSLNVGFDLIFVGLLHLGAEGIPLGLLTSLLVTSGLAVRRNLCDLRSSLDAVLGRFSLKVLAGTAVTALAVWLLRRNVAAPASTRGDFAYLCLVCGAGSVVFLAGLVATRAFTRPLWTLFSRGAEQAEGGGPVVT